MDNGWIKIYRKITDNPLYFSEPFTRMQAWIDLLILANHNESFFYVRGNKVVVKRGEVGYSQENLAKRWCWSRWKVNKFLTDLEREQQIVQQKNKVTTLISILKYEDYQQSATTERTTDQQQTVQQTNTNKNDKNDKNTIGVKKTPNNLHAICKKIFLDKYRELFDVEYYFEAKDSANLNAIIKKIKFNRTKKNMSIDDESTSMAFGRFLNAITDKWLLSNFSIPNINSKFNEIISHAKNEQKTPTKSYHKFA